MSGNASIDRARLLSTRAAHSEGAQAQRNGQHTDANPYPGNTRLSRAWIDGWQFAATMQTLQHSGNAQQTPRANSQTQTANLPWLPPSQP